MLEDLEQLVNESREHFDKLSYTGDVRLSAEFARVLERCLQSMESNSTVEILPFSIRLISKAGHRTDLPSSILWYGHTFWRLAKALDQYKDALQRIRRFLKDRHNLSKSDLDTKYLKHFPSPDLRAPDPEIGKAFEEAIFECLGNNDAEFFIKLMTEREWWIKPVAKTESTPGKTLDRNDVFYSSLVLSARLVAANAAKVPIAMFAFAYNPDLRKAFEALDIEEEDYKSIREGASQYSYRIQNNQTVAKNLIFYGAPGTGKSYSIAQEVDEVNTIRTVFHPDTQYGDFVGCLKPVMNGDKVGYGFRAGPFTEAVIKATNEPNQLISLVIEEINRAPAAAVFGEIFQLLDRASDGSSTYPISISDPDMLAYLNQNTNNIFDHGRLVIPANLSIFATMNSSDQAVMPLDTAFKRRWEFRYLPIDYQKASKGTLEIPTEDSSFSIEWSKFAKVINDTLSIQNIPEDRLLGHRFLSEAELANDAKGALKGKIFMYLWDDVLRHGRKGLIFLDGINTFGDLSRRYEENRPVFNSSIEGTLADHSSSTQDASNSIDLDLIVENDGE